MGFELGSDTVTCGEVDVELGVGWEARLGPPSGTGGRRGGGLDGEPEGVLLEDALTCSISFILDPKPSLPSLALQGGTFEIEPQARNEHTSSLPAFPEKTFRRDTRPTTDVGRERVRCMLSGAGSEADEAANAVNIVAIRKEWCRRDVQAYGDGR